jgi:hypothetical protein
MNIYPFSQDPEGAYWVADRRILPLRLVATDRRILDFAFKCPVELKLGNKIFLMASLGIYGNGANIPNANDGVKPNSGSCSRALQVIARKLQNRTFWILRKLSRKSLVQNSWSDYQKYWQESKKLAKLIDQYGGNLSEFDGKLFKGHGRDLLVQKKFYFAYGFRLLQIAVWKDLIDSLRRRLNETGL